MRIWLLAGLAACGGDPPADGTHVLMHFARSDGFFSAPFPSLDLQTGSHIDISGFPNPEIVALIAQAKDVLESDARGFATTGAVYLPMSDGLDPDGLPSIDESTGADSPVALVNIDPKSPAFARRQPISVAFLADGGPYGAPNLLALLPIQGLPLEPDTTYAAIVRRDLEDADGHPLGAGEELRRLAEHRHLRGLGPQHEELYFEAVNQLLGAGIDAGQLSGFTVFHTDDPTRVLSLAREVVLQEPRPLMAPFILSDTFPDYCVFASAIDMPVLQAGEPPYTTEGGAWVLGPGDVPVLQTTEEARIFVTVPRVPSPEDGYPVALFVRTGGGGDTPLWQRGVADAAGNMAPGSGPARELAESGWAAITVDGPHGGLRNVTGGDEQLLMFNFLNAPALRDNVRESAVELVLLANLLERIQVDASFCPGASGEASFDTGKVAIMGHSMGATIAPLAMAIEPRFVAGVMSGAGGSILENVLYKQKPFPIKPLAELIVGFQSIDRVLEEHDPVLTLVQWAAEPSDPQVYARKLLDRHLLVFQGIVDHYILPPIANSLTVPMQLDLAGESLDATSAELAAMEPLETALERVGRGRIALPAQANRGETTGVVVQQLEDGIQDGHEVMFQLDGPKAQYRCFFKTLAAGEAPLVPVDNCD